MSEIESGKSKAEICREHEIHPTLITRWEKEYNQDLNKAFKGNGNTYKESARNAELERIVGQLYAENAFLKKTLVNLKVKMAEEQRKKNQR